MNAFGFAGWYRQRTPIEFRLAESFDRHWRSLGGQIALDEAQVDKIPDPERFTVKNTATLALQLLKRFRNIRYADYAGRIPPSVVLSYYAALSARPNTRLCDMVIRVATWILGDIEDAVLNRRLLHVSNPLCPDDVFTDRWPEFDVATGRVCASFKGPCSWPRGSPTIGTFRRRRRGVAERSFWSSRGD